MPEDPKPLPPADGQPPPEAVAPGRPVVRPAGDQRTEIVLNPRTAPRPAPAEQKKHEPAKAPETKDSFREVVETIVFVVVLVLLLKTFLAEAFVIPTGSMATTLLGYNIETQCQKCGYTFLVNASKQEDPQEDRPQDVVSCTCPNCQFQNPIQH
jgi:signal peptidase I